MKKTALLLGLTALILGSFLLLPKADLVEAYQGDPNVKGPSYSEDRHQAMTQAFENNDYNAWKELMQGKGRILEVINEENFSMFAEAHRLASQGDLEGAREIKAELGLGQGRGQGHRRGDGSCQFNR